MGDRRRYRKKSGRDVTAVQLDLETEGFSCETAGYSSGMSVWDATFFGRMTGRKVAAREARAAGA